MDIENFINEFKKTFIYDTLCETLDDEQLFEHRVVGDKVIWLKEQMRQMWLMWQAAKAVPEWISVNCKEPPLNTMVLICWSDAPDVEPEKDFMDHDVDHGVNYWVNYNNGDEPSHWILLPKPLAQGAKS